MQIHRIWYGVQGSRRLANYALRWTHMVTKQAKRKARILAFWQKYGAEAALEAFGVKRRTLYDWQARLKKGGGQLEALNNKSRRPHQVRQRLWPNEVKAAIRSLRIEHPNLGPDKVALLLPNHLSSVSPLPKARTIARIISDT